MSSHPDHPDPSRRPLLDAGALVERVERDFGVRLASVVPVDGGLDVGAVVLRGEDHEGSAYAVKVRRDRRRGPILAQLAVAEHLHTGVPRPLVAGAGEPWSSEQGDQLVVLPWITGRRAMDGGMGLDQWAAYGSLLAHVHDTTVPAAAAALLPRDDLGAAALARWRATDAGLLTLQDHEDPTVHGLHELWVSNRTSLTALADGLATLADRLGPAPGGDVLVHADAHLGNVVVDDAGQVWLIDWDEVALAPRERDLMFVVEGVLSDQLVTPAEQAAFFGAYGEVEVDPALLAVYRCTWALQDMTEFAREIVDPTTSDASRERALVLVSSIFWPSGIVALAAAALAAQVS